MTVQLLHYYSRSPQGRPVFTLFSKVFKPQGNDCNSKNTAQSFPYDLSTFENKMKIAATMRNDCHSVITAQSFPCGLSTFQRRKSFPIGPPTSSYFRWWSHQGILRSSRTVRLIAITPCSEAYLHIDLSVDKTYCQYISVLLIVHITCLFVIYFARIVSIFSSCYHTHYILLMLYMSIACFSIGDIVYMYIHIFSYIYIYIYHSWPSSSGWGRRPCRSSSVSNFRKHVQSQVAQHKTYSVKRMTPLKCLHHSMNHGKPNSFS